MLVPYLVKHLIWTPEHAILGIFPPGFDNFQYLVKRMWELGASFLRIEQKTVHVILRCSGRPENPPSYLYGNLPVKYTEIREILLCHILASLY
jgi:hypothetical protein